MSTLKTTFIQHPSAESPAIELTAEGTVALPLSGIGDLADVDEGSGAADGDVLTYDGVGNVWSPSALTIPPASGIVQIVQGTYTTRITLTSSSFVDAGPSVTITPTSAESKFYIVCYQNMYFQTGNTFDSGATVGISRNGTDIYSGERELAKANVNYSNQVTVPISYLDSPNTTSPLTYKTRAKTSRATVYLQGNEYSTLGLSAITVMEFLPPA